MRVESRTPYRVEEVWLAPLSGTRGIGDGKKNKVYASNPVYGNSFSVFDRFDGTVGFWAFSHARRIMEYPTSMAMPWVSISNGQEARLIGCCARNPMGEAGLIQRTHTVDRTFQVDRRPTRRRRQHVDRTRDLGSLARPPILGIAASGGAHVSGAQPARDAGTTTTSDAGGSWLTRPPKVPIWSTGPTTTKRSFESG